MEQQNNKNMAKALRAKGAAYNQYRKKIRDYPCIAPKTNTHL